jgi:predicted dehydrogenase
MLKLGLIGLGFMGMTHLQNYERLRSEGLQLQVVAVCDTDEEKLKGRSDSGNIDTADSALNMDTYRQYTSIEEMLDNESLDAVDITLPTYLHKEAAVMCLNRGLHVLCEKPMALHEHECDEMIHAARANGKQLLIGQCLRFWPAYEYARATIESGRYGKPTGGYFFRGGGTPTWASWLTKKELSGGALMDMHVHDTDMIHWLYGKPTSVSCLGRNIVEGSGYDIVSTHYAYEDGMVINAQADWTLQGDFGFEMSFRMNFERGNLVFQGGQLRDNPNEGKGFAPDLSEEMGYYYQLKYFVESLAKGSPMDRVTPESAKDTIRIVEAEMTSANKQGAWITVD